MNKCSRVLFGLLLLVGCERNDSQQAVRRRTWSAEPLTYHALVIGVSDYRCTGWPQLGTARNDAEAVAHVLTQRYGFQTTLLLESAASREGVIAALDQMMQLHPNDALLIYFAGHGYYDTNMDEGYWIPFGAVRTKGKRLAREDWLWNSTLQRIVSALPARHVLVIADTCYGGSLFRGVEPPIKNKPLTWYRRAAAAPSRYLITSGNLEPVLDSGIRHSVFAQEILNVLQYSDFEVFSASDLGMAIRDSVGSLTGQMVCMGPLSTASHAGGEFVFMAPEQAQLWAGKASERPQKRIMRSFTPPPPVEPEDRLTQLTQHLHLGAEVPENFISPRILACLGPRSEAHEELASAVRRSLQRHLETESGCLVVERAAFETVLEELELGQSRMADRRVATRIGKLLPASLILFGEIIEVDSEKELYLRVVDTETTRVLTSQSVMISGDTDIDAATKRLSISIAKAIRCERPLVFSTRYTGGDQLEAGIGFFHGVKSGAAFEVSKRAEGFVSKKTVLGTVRLIRSDELTSLFRAEWSTQPELGQRVWLREINP